LTAQLCVDFLGGEAVTTADWGLVISIMSAGISLAGFVWNVWSKFIYPKPKVRVGFSKVFAFDVHTPKEERPEALRLSATNMGPTEVTLTHAVLRPYKSFFEEGSMGILNILPHFPRSADDFPETANPFSGLLPKKLQVGEDFCVYLIPHHETLAKGDYRHIGFCDSFGRYHWCSRHDILRTLPYIREACAKANKAWR
jgi:hypothetical protein